MTNYLSKNQNKSYQNLKQFFVVLGTFTRIILLYFF